MATKTATQRFTDELAKADAAIATERAEALSQVQEYRQKAENLQAALDTAREAVAGIDAAWSSGNDSISVEDYKTAKAEVEKAKKVLAGTNRKVKAVKVPNTDTSAAKTFAEALRRSFDGWVPVVVTTSAPGEVIPPTAAFPIAVVSQSKPVTIRGNDALRGTCQATVEVRYYRLPIHRPMDPEALDRILNPHGEDSWSVQRADTQETEDEAGSTIFIDSDTSVSAAAVLDMPFIEETRNVDSDVAGTILGECVDGIPRDRFYAVGSRRGTHTVKVAEDGTRTLKVNAVFGLAGRRSGQQGTLATYRPTDINVDHKAIAASMIGEFISGVGRVTGCEYKGVIGQERVTERLTDDMHRVAAHSYEVTVASTATPPEGAEVRS